MEESTPSLEELVPWLCEEFSVSETSSRTRLGSLRSGGLIGDRNGIVFVHERVHDWLQSGEDSIPIGVIHSRIRFVGELLNELREPRSGDDLRELAATYGLNWERLTQIDNRRGWLESAGLIEGTNQRMSLTEAGRTLLDQLDVYEPDDGRAIESSPPVVRRSVAYDQPKYPLPTEQPSDVEAELLASSTDSGNSVRFERAVRDAFAFLGFVAEHLGGSGKTDVLLTAPLGSRDTYRAAVDAKTTASGSLGENQVDWITLQEHRAKHRADYSLLVAPNPAGKRLMERARQCAVAVLSAEQLAELCRRHRDAPISLVDYRHLFDGVGEVDLTTVDERVEHVVRLRRLATALCRQLPEKTDRFGRMSARDVQLLLGEEAEGISEGEIQGLLDVLSHPLIGAVYRFDDDETYEAKVGYVLATSREACQRLINTLADEIGKSDPDR